MVNFALKMMKFAALPLAKRRAARQPWGCDLY